MSVSVSGLIFHNDPSNQVVELLLWVLVLLMIYLNFLIGKTIDEFLSMLLKDFSGMVVLEDKNKK